MSDSPDGPARKPCVICGSEIPERARKCTECGQWQSRASRLVSAHLPGLVTLLPILTLCVALLDQLDLLWRSDIDAFGLACKSLNDSGRVRRYRGETLVLTTRGELLFLGNAWVAGADDVLHATERTLYDGQSATQQVSATPIAYQFDVAGEVVERLCGDGSGQFDVRADILSLERSKETLRIGACGC